MAVKQLAGSQINDDFQLLGRVYFEICLHQGQSRANKQCRQYQSRYPFHFSDKNENLGRKFFFKEFLSKGKMSDDDFLQLCFSELMTCSIKNK